MNIEDKDDLQILLERVKLQKSATNKDENKYEKGYYNALLWVLEQICDLQRRLYKEIR